MPIRIDYPYRSYSQGITTYCLKKLAKNKKIELVSYKKVCKTQLDAYKEMLGNYDAKSKENQMHYCYFYKLCDFDKKDIRLIKDVARMLNIDLSNLRTVTKNHKIYLKMKSSYKYHQLLSGEYFKNMRMQKEILLSMIEEYMDYLFDNDCGRKRKK